MAVSVAKPLNCLIRVFLLFLDAKKHLNSLSDNYLASRNTFFCEIFWRAVYKLKIRNGSRIYLLAIDSCNDHHSNRTCQSTSKQDLSEAGLVKSRGCLEAEVISRPEVPGIYWIHLPSGRRGSQYHIWRLNWSPFEAYFRYCKRSYTGLRRFCPE